LVCRDCYSDAIQAWLLAEASVIRSPTATACISSISAAFGAFFGLLSAFYLGRVEQRSDRREKRHAALITAQYALMSQWNIVEAIRVQHLEHFRNDPIRFTKLKLYWFPMAPTFDGSKRMRV